MCTEERIRWFIGRSERQVEQSQPMTGMPTDVLVPKNVSWNSIEIIDLKVDVSCACDEALHNPLRYVKLMLTLLKISNLALVDKLTWQIDAGLVGITGETGAGKSVIVGALKLVLGERADKTLIRTGESSCTVEAVFELSDGTIINSILDEAGIEACEDSSLIIKRVVGSSSNRQFINNSPATLGVLRELGAHLVDLHGPHDHQSLLSNERQLQMLDAYAVAKLEKANYGKAYRAWKSVQNELEVLQKSEQANEQELDLLRFQVEEISSAEICLEEEAEIEDRYSRVSNASKLEHVSAQIVSLLGESAVMAQLGEVQRLARELEKYDSSVVDLLGGLDQAVLEIQELERGVLDYAEHLESDPSELQRLEERIHSYESLKRKYGPSLSEVLEHLEQAAKRLDSIENRGERLHELEQIAKQSLVAVNQAAEKLTRKRKKAAPKLAAEIAQHLKDLGFQQAEFALAVVALDAPFASGLETVDFQFGPNPGEPLKPLKQIASSGEISRVMLAVKSALADQDSTPLMVFDEIDANVGGEIARAVGEKMAVLGANHQVISITHFPQVAAVADEHFVVTKVVESGRTVSRLRAVAGEQRIDELVRMLGGGQGEEARAMASSLLA